jgi:putative tryptophan/tyrosine transport system substrate-binding protein
MKRRDVIALIARAAVASPIITRTWAAEGTRLIGVLMAFREGDPEGTVWLSAFVGGLQGLGWTVGGALRMEVRWAAGSVQRRQSAAEELVGMEPDVILSHGTPVTAALQRLTKTIPIVFVTVGDPVGSGYVKSLSHPGGNLTGFIFAEAAMGGKWLELLTQTAPRIKRAAIMFNPDTAPDRGTYYMPSFEAAARSLKVDAIGVPVHGDADIDAGVVALRRQPGGGLVAMGDPFLLVHRAPIISQTARNNIPAVYFQTVFVKEGGLLSYGPDNADIFRRAAPYVDRILRGAKPAELPVQVPTKFELAINLKTAKSLGLTVPPSLLAQADEVIE